jgi:dynactin complex subunit
VNYPKEEALKQVCQNRRVRFGKPDSPILAENSRISGQCNKGFKVALEKHMSKNKNTKRKSKDKVSRIKYQTYYTCRDKSHHSKDCPKTRSFIHKVVNDNISHAKPKNDTSIIKMISSPYDSPHAIWVAKQLLLTMKDPTRLGYENLINQVGGGLRCIGNLSIIKRWNHYYIVKCLNHYANINLM